MDPVRGGRGVATPPLFFKVHVEKSNFFSKFNWKSLAQDWKLEQIPGFAETALVKHKGIFYPTEYIL